MCREMAQRYLAHKKLPSPRTLPWGYTCGGPTGGGAVSYERGTPVQDLWEESMTECRYAQILGLKVTCGSHEGRCKATWKGGFKLSRRKAGLLNSFR